MKNKSLNLIVGLLMLVALAGAMLLVKQNQNTERGAYFAGTKLLMQPMEATGNVGDSVLVKLYAETEKLVSTDSALGQGAGGCGTKPAEQCNVNANEGSMLRVRPVCINGAWDFDDQLCNLAGRKDICGEKDYCCPSVGGKWTTDMTACTDPIVGGYAKISSLDTIVCYGSNLKITNPDTQVVLNEEALKTKVDVSLVTVDGKSCVRLIAISDLSAKPDDLKGGMVELATLKFIGESNGSGNVEYIAEKTKVGGYNPYKSASDTALKIGTVTGTTYKIGSGENPTQTPTEPPTGDEPVLNYQISFGNVKTGDGKCVVNWPMQIIVLANGESKAYSGIKAVNPTASGEKIVFKGSLPLTGFNHTSNVAAFIKGPKHLQMKYAVQNQGASYEKAGGELVLTKDAATSTVYNFSAYPMIPGDVVGPNTDTPDGWIDGVDFAYVKARSLTHETVSEGNYIKADLDGNCQVNSNDVNVLKISLQTKQGQLY